MDNLKELNRIVNETLTLTYYCFKDWMDYYQGKINGQSLTERIKINMSSLSIDEFKIECTMEWLSRLPENASDGLPIASSGSFWTGFCDSDFTDYLFENVSEDKLLKMEEVNGYFGLEMSNYWRNGIKIILNKEDYEKYC